MKKNWRNNVRSTKYEVRSTNKNLVPRNSLAPLTSYLVIPLIFFLLLASCSNKEETHQHDTYTCPMHPTVISDRPGACPVCGMDLVRKIQHGEEDKITGDLAKLLKSPNEAVVASISTIKGQYRTVPVSAEAQGVVTYDTRNIYTIPARAGGRLEKTYLKYAFQPVAKGQKVADIYSPELITAQRELLFLLENDSGNMPLINVAKNKLRLFGFASFQINNLIERKAASNILSVYSPYSGYIISDQQVPSTSAAIPSQSTSASSMSDGMSATQSNSSAFSNVQDGSENGIIREGNYVSTGQTLFRIVNNDALRIELDLPAKQAGSISKDDSLQVDFGDGTYEKTAVDFVQPFFSEGQDFVKIRVYTKKTKGLHPGQIVNATIQLSTPASLWVPKASVLDLGTQKVVFIKERGVLKPKTVVTGMASQGLVEIQSGLASSEEIAGNAQYLIDSESFIKTTE